MTHFVKISAPKGAGKTFALAAIAAACTGRHVMQFDGHVTAFYVIRSLRGRRDVVVLIDNASEAVLAELEGMMAPYPSMVSHVFATIRTDDHPASVTVQAPMVAAKANRAYTPTLSMLQRDEAIAVALAKRDAQWRDALQGAGVGVVE